MPLASLGFLVGVLICQSLTELPMREWSFLIIVLIPLIFRFPEYRLAIFILLGFLYSVLIAHGKLATQFSPEMDGRDFLVNGTVSMVTSKTAQHSRFWLTVSGLSEFSGNVNKSISYQENKNPPQRIQLTWYKDAPTIIVGQRWQLKVRLKHPRGFSNPGAFDYEGWLYQQGIDATGYVRSGKQNDNVNKLLGTETGLLIWIQGLRESLSSQISEALINNDHKSLVTALVVGDRQSMTDKQWSTLTRTGTNHLMAISGLHIGLIAGLFFYLANGAWRFVPGASLKIPAPRIAAVAAIVAALIYAALAGFTLPTQRAFIMVTVAMLAVWLQRPVASSQVLATALLVVLLYDHTAVMNGSFWLSFAAVAVIVFTLSNRAPLQTRAQKWWRQWGRIQWVITIGLVPLLLFWFQQVPIVSPIANFIAVPVVSLVTVPLSLLGGVCLLVAPLVGQFLLILADYSLAILWPVLESMASIDALVYKSSQPPQWTLLPAIIGIGLLLAPRGFPARWLGVVWLLPLVFYPKPEISHGAYRLTLLDVGHGLATVVRTRNHVMVYDVGPRYSDKFNAGDVAVLPFLKSVGINQIDRLILSHDDIDHTGGFEALNATMKIKQLTVGPGVSKSLASMDYCRSGQQWQWDGVRFRILHPPGDYRSTKDNNNSCLVQISTGNDKLLLTGDIEHEVETQFIKFFAGDDDNLRADVLLVPHHGSLSSSSDAFLRAVKPDYALISAGYNNRYGLPRPEVLARYQATGARILNTGHEGAISFLMDQRGLSELTLHRHQARHYWSSVTK